MHFQLLMVSRDVVPPEIKDYAPKHFCVVYTPRCVQVHDGDLSSRLGVLLLLSQSLSVNLGLQGEPASPTLTSTPTHSTGVRGVYQVFCLIRGLTMKLLQGLKSPQRTSWPLTQRPHPVPSVPTQQHSWLLCVWVFKCKCQHLHSVLMLTQALLPT